MNIEEIGKLIGEEIAKEPGIAFYPGGFKPPHKGHFAAAQALAAKPYITQVNVLIGRGERGGINAEQSKAIWDLYLKAQPNPKIKVEISKEKSPIKDIYRWFADDLNRKAYVAAAAKEADDLGYFKGLKDAYGDRVQEEIVNDQFVDSDGDRVSGSDFRSTIATLRQRYLDVKNNPGDKRALNDYNTTYLYFKSLFPEAVIQKGYLDEIQKILGINFPEPTSLQEIKENQPNPKNQPQWVWLEYKSKNKLNPIIFGNDEKVDPEVKDLLLKIANYFWEGLEIPQPFEDVLLTGSSVNYNYTPTSDIDLHIVVDFSKFDSPDLLKKYFDEAKINWNRVHDLKLGKQNIEVYVQDVTDHPKYRGEYSLMNDKWLHKPSFEKIDIPDEDIEEKAKIFKQQIDKLEKTGKDNPEKSIELINKIKERLKNFRQSGLDKDGEYSLENLAFKNLRNTGYLEKLSKLKNTLIDKTLSLNESIDKNSLFEKFMSYACQELQIKNPPTLEVRYEFGEEQPSFGAYVPSNHHIFINPSNRNMVDVLRTLAHELVHAKQNELGILTPTSGETGSEHENDANSIAGILMRDYGKQNPDIYSIGVLKESVTKDTITCDKCGWSWKKKDGGKDMYVCHRCGHDNTPKLNEKREGWYKYIKNKLPNMPEYVLKDWIYRKVDNYKDYESFNKWLDKWIVDLKWEYKTNFPITMDIFTDNTQNQLQKRIGGEIVKTVDKDTERHQTQQNLLQTKGISTEPIILFKTKDGKYDLGEGWHRTIQTFKKYPKGYIQPKVYIGIGAEWVEPDFKPLDEAKEDKQKITRIYFDLDGVLAGFDDQFKKYNDEGLDFKSYIGKYGSSKAWDLINKGEVKFWSTMPWNPGGKELYNSVMKLAKDKNIEVWILSSPGLDPKGDAKKGKNLWVDKHLNIPMNRRVYKQAKEKHTEAKPGYMLIDDLGLNVKQFIEAGGTGIKNNPEDSTESIKKLYKFKYE